MRPIIFGVKQNLDEKGIQGDEIKLEVNSDATEQGAKVCRQPTNSSSI
jgi:hypothetical protein